MLYFRMDFKHFTAGQNDNDRRLDRVLRNFLRDENLSSIYKALRKGFIKVNGKKAEASSRIREGDDIQIASFLIENNSEKSKDSGVNSKHKSQQDCFNLKLDEITVFKNDYILILNKPYDISVQPSDSDKSPALSQIVQKQYEKTHQKASLSFKTGPLHRLDRKTTGLLAFSQNLEGAKWFSEAIKKHTVQKIYLAVLEGKLTKKEVWEDEIAKRENTEQKFHTVTVNSSQKGKAAYSEVRPLKHAVFEGKEITLAQVLIKTGRTHQIRSQCAYHGFPLLGDTAYGGSKIKQNNYGKDFFLHAEELHFPQNNPLNLPETIIAPEPDFLNLFY